VLDVPIREIKHLIGLGIIFPIIGFFAEYLEKGNTFASILFTVGIFVVWGMFSVIMTLQHYKDWSELNEYKKHGTIHGVRAYKL